jgi:hypothetical protein
MQGVTVIQWFSPAAIRPASKAYLETCQFLQRNGAYESVGVAEVEASESVDNADLKEATHMQATLVPTTNPYPTPTSVVRGDVFSLQGGGEVIANLPESMSQRDYDDLKDWLELMIRKAGRKVLSAASPTAMPMQSNED